jgi:diguanylate cyclase (GGDEF)-like protein
MGVQRNRGQLTLTSPEGYALGALCVADRKCRNHTADDIEVLSVLAEAAMANVEMRRVRRQAAAPDTGDLPSRRSVFDQLRAAHRTAGPVAVLGINVDHAKRLDEPDDAVATDALLRATAVRLRSSVRQGDVIARLGEDQFAVFLMGVGDQETAEEIARRIARKLHEPVPFRDEALKLVTTFGAVVVRDGPWSAGGLLRAADAALARAREEGPGGLGWGRSPDAQHAGRSAAVLRGFDEALDADDARVGGATAVLQPIVRLTGAAGSSRTGLVTTVALEALARWKHPTLGEILPSELFPLIGPARAVALSQTVRAAALKAMASLRCAGLTDARLALNLSTPEAGHARTAEGIAAEVRRAGLPLDAIEIEITEEVLLEELSDSALRGLIALREGGARLVLDDFGTGRSGLSQLLRLPLDAVKIDKCFVRPLGVDPRASEIVQATVSMARGLGLTVVAEGIETERQAEIAASLGCDAGQGYLYARPMPVEDLQTWLQRRLVAAA